MYSLAQINSTGAWTLLPLMGAQWAAQRSCSNGDVAAATVRSSSGSNSSRFRDYCHTRPCALSCGSGISSYGCGNGRTRKCTLLVPPLTVTLSLTARSVGMTRY